MSKEAMKLALEHAKRDERHLNHAETRYWCRMYRDIAEKAVEALAKPDFWEGYVPEPDKRQQALDKKAQNARELGLDYEPAQQEPVAWPEEHLKFLNFLYGAGEFEGVWFEQKHQTEKGTFWWRKHLRRLFDAPPPQPKEPEQKTFGYTLEETMKCWNLGYAAAVKSLAQPEQEPVAWGIIASNTGRICQVELDADEVEGHNPKHIVPLYTSPPAQRTWVGLTNEELSEVYNQADWDTVNGWEYERAIEAKLRSKNEDRN
jgi:hypothetical protein